MRPYWHGAHLELPADLAPVLRLMLEPGRRAARNDGWLVGNPHLTAFLSELDHLAAIRTPTAPAFAERTEYESPADQCKWLTTSEAAVVLGVSERRVRQISNRLVGRRINGRRMWLEADVREEADARLECAGSSGVSPK